MIDKSTLIFKLSFFLVFFAACANSGDSTSEAPTPQKNEPAPTPVPPNSDSADASFETQGIIQFSLTQPELADSLQAYLVGKADTHQAVRESASSSRFSIRNVKPGRYDLVLTAVDPDSLDLSQPIIKGLRINGLQIADRPLKLDALRLELTQTVQGEVHSIDGPIAGAEVRLVGTNYVAFTNRAGHYSIPGVPKGQHRLQVSKDGYHSGRIEFFRLEAGSSKNADPIQLQKMTLWEAGDLGPAILSSVDDEDNPAKQLAVEFILIPPETANMMRIGEQSDLTDVEWQALQTSLLYTFNNPGTKTLYVQFSKDRTQLSAVFERRVSIQLP